MNFGGIILRWYQKNLRPLPWRQSTDPYHIWLSEIILQQTRVAQGTAYYLRFLEEYPDVHSLAAAEEREVLKLWQGLGYYSRARNLHHTARQISASGGKFPDSYKDLLKLKGIGPYTAAAISSICFGEARAVVDGNVARVLARISGMEKAVNSTAGSQELETKAAELMAAAVAEGTEPGTQNQALMEFGALQCVPVNPGCGTCPVGAAGLCVAHGEGSTERIPLKQKKKSPVDRFLVFFVIEHGKKVVLEKRGNEDIWRSLYQFPMSEAVGLPEDEAALLLEFEKIYPASCQLRIRTGKLSRVFRHQLSHQKIHARFLHLESDQWPLPLPGGWEWTGLDSLPDFPVPRLIERYMDSYKF